MKTAKIKGWVDTQYSMLGLTGAESFQIVQTPVKSKYSHGLRAVCNNSNEVPMFPFLPFTFLTHQHQREERISRLWHYCRVGAICKLASTVSCLLTASRQLRCTTSPSYITNILAKLPYCNFWWKTLGCFTQLDHSAGHCSHVSLSCF